MSGATKWIPSGLGFTGPPPLTPEKRLAYAASNKTGSQIIEDLLRLVGLTNIDSPLPGSSIPGIEGLLLGTLQPVALPVGQSPSSLIQRIDDLEWVDTVELEDGLITRIPRTITPATDAVKTFTEGVNIANLKRSRNLDGAYANVLVTGISGTGNDGISQYIVQYASNFEVPDANGLIDTYPYSDDLIETAEVAEAWGQTFMGVYGRIQEAYEAELLNGDPSIRAGSTISLVSTKFQLTSLSRFLVKSVREVAQGGGAYITYLTLVGSATASGEDANLGPIVLIKILFDLEYLDGVRTIIAIFDASESYDPDAPEGSLNNGIVTWEWSGDPVDPTPSNNGKQAVAVYTDGDEEGATVTLRLGDSHGKHTSKTVTLHPNPNSDLFVRDLWAATPVDGVIFSNNGGRSFATMGVPDAKGVCEVAGKTYNLGWDSAGELWLIQASMIAAEAEIVLTGKNISAASITIDDQAEETGFCWAGGEDGHVHMSDSSGELGSWVQRTTETTKLPAAITYISESPFAQGSLQATAARGLYISFDSGASWVLVFQHPNVGALSTHFTGGFVPLTPESAESKGFVSFQGTRSSGEPHFVMERTDDDHPSDFAFPAADLEVDIQAITLETDGSELFAVGTDGSGVGGSWAIAPDADGEFERRAWDNVRSGVPHHAIRDPRLFKIAFFAAENEVGKAFGGFISTARIRAGKAWKVGLGDLHLVPPPAGNLVWIGNNAGQSLVAGIWALTSSGFERRADSPLNSVGWNQVLLSVGNGVLICYSQKGSGFFGDRIRPPAEQNAYRSIDGGFTWDPLDITFVGHMACATPGTVYATVGTVVNGNVTSIARSDDSGASWVTMGVGTPGTMGGVHPSPTNPLTVVTIWEGVPADHWMLSTDGGVTFNAISTNPFDNTVGARQLGEAGTGQGAFAAVTVDDIAFVWKNTQAGGSQIMRALLPAGSGGPVTPLAVVPSNFLVGSAGRMYDYGGDGVLSSEDNGQSWSPYYDAARDPFAGAGSSLVVSGFVPKDLTNDAFVLPNSTALQPPSALLRQSITADEGEVWVSLQEELEAFANSIGYTHQYYCYNRGAVRITEDS